MRSPKRMTVHRGTKIERDSSSQSQSRSFHGNTGAKIEEIDRNAIDAWKRQILFLEILRWQLKTFNRKEVANTFGLTCFRVSDGIAGLVGENKSWNMVG
jgi:hypothetical protein